MSSQSCSNSWKSVPFALLIFLLGYAGVIPAGMAGEQEDRTRQLLSTQRDYYNQGNEIDDLSLYLGMYANDAVRVTPGGTQRGIEEIRKSFATSLRTWKAKVIYKNGVVQGNTIAFEFSWVATHRASGKTIEMDMATFVAFDDNGKRSFQSVYYDTAKMAKFLEGANAASRQ